MEKLVEPEKLTVEEAIDRLKFGGFYKKLSIIILFYMSLESVDSVALMYVGTQLLCDWQITHSQLGMLTTSTSIGMILGSFFVAHVSDRYGRWPGLVLYSLWSIYFGGLCATAPNLAWLFLLRVLTGMSISGFSQLTTTMLCDFFPTRYRNTASICFFFGWPSGVTIATLMALVMFDILELSWRLYFVAISFLSAAIMLPALLWVPHSPRQLQLQGRHAEAKAIIDQMAKMNGMEPFHYQLVKSKNATEKLETFKEALQKIYLSKTKKFVVSVCLAYLCLLSNILSMHSVTLFTTNPYLTQLDCSSTTSVSEIPPVVACCKRLSKSDYITALIGSSGIFAGSILCSILMYCFNRKTSFAIGFIMLAVCFTLSNFCLPESARRVLLFLSQMAAYPTNGISYIYIGEIFPTSFRSTGTSIGYAISRFGQVISNMVVYVGMLSHPRLILVCLAVINVVATLAAICLPIETRNRPLAQTFDDVVAEEEDGEDEEEVCVSVERKESYDTFAMKKKTDSQKE